MVGLDEDALICDLAETYHVFDWRQLPVRTTATLATGLGPDSRIKRKMTDTPAPVNTLLLAIIADCLRIFLWRETKDGQKGRNPPESIVSTLYDRNNPGEEMQTFDSADDFNAWRDKMLGGEECQT